ncbi:MAG: hypothetical protein IT371_21280 [Deltaproteobacteria bacterium]|nr:hypothetical protein [Deltaproteobacteria bacterium]
MTHCSRLALCLAVLTLAACHTLEPDPGARQKTSCTKSSAPSRGPLSVQKSPVAADGGVDGAVVVGDGGPDAGDAAEELCAPEPAPPPPYPATKVVFYGNLGTWGSLGVDDHAKTYRTAEEVAARYEELCTRTRTQTGLGEKLACQADLIAVSPRGRVARTESVAQLLVDRYKAPLSLDIRSDGHVSPAAIKAEVEQIFRGKTRIISKAFLEKHPVGLSLDFEPQICDGGYGAISARAINGICGVHRQIMAEYGHDVSKLDCFLYEYGRPTIVADGENLEPYVYPMLMSVADRDRVTRELVRDRKPTTSEAVVSAALDLKALWIDWMRDEYKNAKVTGCMFFTVPYLTIGQRDHFSFLEGMKRFGQKCDVISFQ